MKPEKKKLVELIADGTITIDELANAPELIERSRFVRDGLNACEENLLFPFGKAVISCYAFVDSAGEYEAWGDITRDGVFSCYTNWGGNHLIGRVNLTNPTEVFLALDDELSRDLRRFLQQQIEMAAKKTNLNQ